MRANDVFTLLRQAARYSANEAALATFNGVVLSCRAMRAETEILLYKLNAFCFPVGYDVPYWIELLSEKKRAAIRMVQLDCSISRFVLNFIRPMRQFQARLLVSFRSDSRHALLSFERLPNLKLLTVLVDEGRPEAREELIQSYVDTKKVQVVFDEVQRLNPVGVDRSHFGRARNGY